MALTRARPVSGPEKLQQSCQAIIKDVLTTKRDAGKLVSDIASMRGQIYKEHGTDTPWAIKHYRGGLVDVEFISQVVLNAK